MDGGVGVEGRGGERKNERKGEGGTAGLGSPQMLAPPVAGGGGCEKEREEGERDRSDRQWTNKRWQQLSKTRQWEEMEGEK